MKNTETGSAARDHVAAETILKVSKEVAIKFIETGRLTPATFDKTFRDIHNTIKETVTGRNNA